MFGRRAVRPQGEPENFDKEVKRAMPSLPEGQALVYTGPGPDRDNPAKFRFVGSFDTWADAAILRRYQTEGFIVYS